MRKWKLRWGLASLVALLAVAAVALWPREERITWANFDRIKRGMSRVEVEAILGLPGDHTTGLLDWGDGNIVDCSILAPIGDTPELVIRLWATDTAFAAVAFDGSGHVIFAQVKPCSPANVGYLDKLVWRIKRQWRRWFAEPAILAFVRQTGELCDSGDL